VPTAQAQSKNGGCGTHIYLADKMKHAS